MGDFDYETAFDRNIGWVTREELALLRGKRVGCFTTQQLKFAWMGGNRAIRQMSDAIAQKGGEVAASGIVHWSHPQRETMIQRVVNELATVSPVNV